MALKKELQLIFDYKNAPESFKKVADQTKAIEASLTKKQAQAKALNAEIDELQRQYAESEKAFNAELNAWKPAAT